MARPKTLIIDSSDLRKMYIEDNMKVSEIAEKLGVSGGAIEKRLKVAGIRREVPRNLLPISDEEIERVYITGQKTVKEAAAELGMSVAGLRKRLVKNGVNRYRKFFVASKEDLARMYWAEGKSLTQIGAILNVDAVTVSNKMKKYGIDRRELVRRNDIPIEDLKRMYVDEKLTMREIAAQFETSKQSVRWKLKQSGLLIDADELAARRDARGEKLYKREHINVYRKVKMANHPNANSDGYVAEHRVMVEKEIGRYLASEEQVHHINMQKLDNRIENFALVTEVDHHRLHKYLERIAVYLLGVSGAKRPDALIFKDDVFWAGKWVKQIDLLANKPASTSFTDLFKAAVDAAPNRILRVN